MSSFEDSDEDGDMAFCVEDVSKMKFGTEGIQPDCRGATPLVKWWKIDQPIFRPDEIPKWMWVYVLKEIRDNNFDSSHDERHFVNVYTYARFLMDAGEPFDWEGSGCKERARRIVLHAAFLHDVIDKKYVEPTNALRRLTRELKEQLYPRNDSKVLTRLICNMSFSKRKAHRLAGEPEFDRQELTAPLKLLCDADALDAYRVERVSAYQNSKYPDDPETARRWCKTILIKRVLIYLSENYIQTPTGRTLAEPMHADVKRFVEKTFESNLEMFDY